MSAAHLALCVPGNQACCQPSHLAECPLCLPQEGLLDSTGAQLKRHKHTCLTTIAQPCIQHAPQQPCNGNTGCS